MYAIISILSWIIGIISSLILLHFVMSLLIKFDVINLGQQFVAKVWEFLNRLFEPVYSPIRSVLPATKTGGIDFSPLILLVILIILQSLLWRLLWSWYYY